VIGGGSTPPFCVDDNELFALFADAFRSALQANKSIKVN